MPIAAARCTAARSSSLAQVVSMLAPGSKCSADWRASNQTSDASVPTATASSIAGRVRSAASTPRHPSMTLPSSQADKRGTARSRARLSCIARRAFSRATRNAKRLNAAKQLRLSAACVGGAAALIASARIKSSTSDINPSLTTTFRSPKRCSEVTFGKGERSYTKRMSLRESISARDKPGLRIALLRQPAALDSKRC